MGRRRQSPVNSPQLTAFLTKLNLDSLTQLAPLLNPDQSNDEGFHEEWPPFRASDLMQIMSVEQSTGNPSYSRTDNQLSYSNGYNCYRRLLLLALSIIFGLGFIKISLGYRSVRQECVDVRIFLRNLSMKFFRTLILGI